MKKKLITILIIIIVTAFGCNNKKNQASKELEKGKVLFNNIKYDSSLICFNNAIKYDSLNSEAYFYLSKVNYLIENYEEGLKYINLAEKRKYNQDSIDDLTLEILSSMKKYDQYIHYCNKIISKNSSNYKIYLKKSAALFNKTENETSNDKKIEELKDALDNINISLNLNKTDNQSYMLRGVIRWQLSDKKGALEDLAQVILNEKRDSSILSKAYRYKGLIEQDLNNLNYAESLLDTAMIFEKNLAILYYNRGDIRISSQKNDLACDDFRKALELGDKDAIDRIRENCK